MGRGVRGGVLLAGALVASALGLVPAAAAPSPAPQQLTASGTLQGKLDTKSTLLVRLHVTQAQGWQHVADVDVVLELRHRSLDLLKFSPGASTLEIVGFGPPARLGQDGLMLGAYFKLDPSKVSLTAKGTTLGITAPIHLLADPPAGARMTFVAHDDLGNGTGLRALTPPVEATSGFSVGTLLLAIAAALFAGGFVGNIFSTRRRPAPKASIYDAVQRRLEEEKAGT